MRRLSSRAGWRGLTARLPSVEIFSLSIPWGCHDVCCPAILLLQLINQSPPKSSSSPALVLFPSIGFYFSFLLNYFFPSPRSRTNSLPYIFCLYHQLLTCRHIAQCLAAIRTYHRSFYRTAREHMGNFSPNGEYISVLATTTTKTTSSRLPVRSLQERTITECCAFSGNKFERQ